jgi:hypothetical protein
VQTRPAAGTSRLAQGTLTTALQFLGPTGMSLYYSILDKLKFSPNTATLRLASLRFFYIHVLKKNWSIAEDAPSEEGASSSADTQSRRCRPSD